MITHIGMLTLNDTATESDRRSISEGLRGLIGQIDGLVSVVVGDDLGLRSGNADIVFQLRFDAEEHWRAYATHPAHQAVIAERIAPVLAEKTFIQVRALEEAVA